MTKRRSITPAPSATQTARKRKAAPRQATSIAFDPLGVEFPDPRERLREWLD